MARPFSYPSCAAPPKPSATFVPTAVVIALPMPIRFKVVSANSVPTAFAATVAPPFSNTDVPPLASNNGSSWNISLTIYSETKAVGLSHATPNIAFIVPPTPSESAIALAMSSFRFFTLSRYSSVCIPVPTSLRTSPNEFSQVSSAAVSVSPAAFVRIVA